MRVLVVCRYKDNFVGNVAPFVREQGAALEALSNERVNGLTSERIVVEYFMVKGNYLKAVGELKKKIKEWKPDIIHAHYGITAIVAEMQSEVPVVTTFHDGETHVWYVNLLSTLFSLRAKHVIYVAQHNRDLSYFKAKNYSIIPCGIDLDKMVITPKEDARKQLGWRDDTKYIVFGGAFDNERKNYALLKQAVERMNGLTGERIEIVELKMLTREECVLRMCGADLFALPSHREGSPQVIKEAMAVNCPSIATDIADIKVLFGDEPGHWLLRNPKNTPWLWEADEKSLDEMVELIKKGLSFPGRTNGRKRIEELGLSNEQVARKIVKIYETILARR